MFMERMGCFEDLYVVISFLFDENNNYING